MTSLRTPAKWTVTSQNVTESSLEDDDVTDSSEDHTEAVDASSEEGADSVDDDDVSSQVDSDVTSDESHSTSMSDEAREDQSVCERGVSVFSCSPLLCLYNFCPGRPSAQCRVNPCGGCSVQWFDASDDVTDQCFVGEWMLELAALI